jgi:hypothetical protein
MSAPNDTLLERDLRGVLRGLDPGPVPHGLRERLARVPESAPRRPAVRERLSRAVVPVLGLAAAILLAVLVGPLLSIGPGPAVQPGTTAGPGSPFDPAIRGPGLVLAPAVEAEALVVLVLLVAGGLVLAVAPSGPRRAVATLVIMAALGFGGAEVLRTHATAGPVASSGGIGVLNVEQTEPAGRYPVYVTAAPGEPFSFGFSVRNDGPLPIRLEGVVRDPNAEEGVVDYPTPRAVWRDGATNGGMTGPTGPVAPFAPTDLAPGEFAVLWLVDTASPCAAGPSFDPATGEAATVGLPPLRVMYSVLGFPRTAAIDLPFDVLQPYRAGCPPGP